MLEAVQKLTTELLPKECKLIWIKRLLKELGISIQSLMKLHVQIDRNIIKSEIDSSSISVHYSPTKLQQADVLTKLLLKLNFEFNVTKQGIINIYSPAWEGLLESLGSIPWNQDFISQISEICMISRTLLVKLFNLFYFLFWHFFYWIFVS